MVWKNRFALGLETAAPEAIAVVQRLSSNASLVHAAAVRNEAFECQSCVKGVWILGGWLVACAPVVAEIDPTDDDPAQDEPIDEPDPMDGTWTGRWLPMALDRIALTGSSEALDGCVLS